MKVHKHKTQYAEYRLKIYKDNTFTINKKFKYDDKFGGIYLAHDSSDFIREIFQNEFIKKTNILMFIKLKLKRWVSRA